MDAYNDARVKSWNRALIRYNHRAAALIAWAVAKALNGKAKAKQRGGDRAWITLVAETEGPRKKELSPGTLNIFLWACYLLETNPNIKNVRPEIDNTAGVIYGGVELEFEPSARLTRGH